MNAEQLLAHFDRISEAPDAIPRLRRFILDLAVKGRLVEQDPNDKPVSSPLRLRKGSSCEISCVVPPGWIRAKVGSVLDFRYGKPLPATKRFVQGPVCVYGSNGVVAYCSESLTQEPAIIIGRKGSAGALNLCLGPSWTTDVAYFVEPPSFFNIRYLFLALQTLDLDSLGKGVKPGLNRNDAYELEIGIPPIPEQHRIVAKVEELMALCDRLEAVQAKRERRRDRLVTASLQCLNNGVTSEDFREQARFHLGNLPRLTTRPEHIQQVRQTILNLAVSGRLVSQDPNDEPACKALEKAWSDNRRKWEERSVRLGAKHEATRAEIFSSRYGDLPAPNTERLPTLPASWEWVNWERVLALGDGSFKRGPFGSALTKGMFVASGYKVYEQYCPINDDCSFARYYITPQRFRELEGFAVKARDFLISCSGTIGRITQVPDEYEEGVINQALLRVRINNKLVEDSFFKTLFRSPFLQEQILSNSTGTAIPNVKGVKELKSIPIPLPPLAEQHRIVAKVDQLMALCDRLEAELATTQTESQRLLEAVLHHVLDGAS